MSDNTDSLHDQPGSPWTQKGFIASAVIVGLLIILGAVLVFTRPSDGDDRADPKPRPTASSSSSTTSPTTKPSDDSACELPAGDQLVPATAPLDTEWELVGTMAAPTAPDTHGPGRVGNGLRTCFAKTPTGALYAAANFVASASAPELRERAMDELTAVGAGRDRALEEAQEPQADSGSRVQLEGFTFLHYTGEAATVDLAFRASRTDGTSGLAHMPISLVWESGDWKASLPASGEVFPGVGPVPDLTGYTPWGGA